MSNNINKMLIDATHPEETRVVVLKNGRVEEFDFESAARKLLRGNIYLAKVTRVEPSLQAAFVDYGGNRHGFLAFSEIHPDYYQIPVADRQALIEEEAAQEAAEEAEVDAHAERLARRRQGPRPENQRDGQRESQRDGNRSEGRGRNSGRGDRDGRRGRPDRTQFSDDTAARDSDQNEAHYSEDGPQHEHAHSHSEAGDSGHHSELHDHGEHTATAPSHADGAREDHGDHDTHHHLSLIHI